MILHAHCQNTHKIGKLVILAKHIFSTKSSMGICTNVHLHLDVEDCKDFLVLIYIPICEQFNAFLQLQPDR